jgi:hypothetical protein
MICHSLLAALVFQLIKQIEARPVVQLVLHPVSLAPIADDAALDKPQHKADAEVQAER